MSIVKGIFLPFFILITLSGCFYARDAGHDRVRTEGLILDAAEGFFIYLNDKGYKDAWELLSERSRQVIIDDVYKASSQSTPSIDRESIARDFNTNGVIFNKYWEALRANFDPDIVLNERVWAFEEINENNATILLKGSGVAKLKMYKEEGGWKVGFVETFWARNPGGVVRFLQTFFIK